MIGKTAQKKASIQIDNKSYIKRNNSYTKNINQSIFWAHPQLQQSIFKQKQEQPHEKNYQGLSIKKNNQGVLGMGRKYAQQDNIFRKRIEAKQYRQVVISEQFVRSSKLFKLLKEQVEISEAKHVKQLAELQEIAKRQQKEAKDLKCGNHQIKLELWELRNQLIEMKSQYEEQEEENNKLAEEYEYLNEEGQEGQIDDEEGEEENQENPQETGQKENEQNNEEVAMEKQKPEIVSKQFQ